MVHHITKTLDANIEVSEVDRSPTLLEGRRIKCTIYTWTRTRKGIGEVVHHSVNQSRLVCLKVVPIVSEVGRSQLHVCGVRKQKEDCCHGSSMNRNHNIGLHRFLHLEADGLEWTCKGNENPLESSTPFPPHSVANVGPCPLLVADTTHANESKTG